MVVVGGVSRGMLDVNRSFQGTSMLNWYNTQFIKRAFNPHKLLILSIGSGKITADQQYCSPPYCIACRHT